MYTNRGSALFAAVLLLCLLTACGNKQASGWSRSLFAMDTYFDLTIYDGQAEAALDAAAHMIRRLEDLWSVTRENSELYTLNHSGGLPVELSSETEDLLARALALAEETGGAFDPTVYPLLTAWGFTTQKYRIPAQEEIDSLLQYTGYSRVQMQGNRVSLPEKVQLDFGGIAKGYTGGQLAHMLRREYGVTSALLNLGGNVQAVGSKPDGSRWRIGIRDPRTDGVLGILEAADTAVVTSGGYERHFTGEDGQAYCHIIDPATGYPVKNDVLSVTVVGEDGAVCDALSTALFVMGADMAADYWRVYGDFEMILLTDCQTIYITDGLAGVFSLDPGQQQWTVQIISNET